MHAVIFPDKLFLIHGIEKILVSLFYMYHISYLCPLLGIVCQGRYIGVALMIDYGFFAKFMLPSNRYRD